MTKGNSSKKSTVYNLKKVDAAATFRRNRLRLNTTLAATGKRIPPPQLAPLGQRQKPTDSASTQRKLQLARDRMKRMAAIRAREEALRTKHQATLMDVALVLKAAGFLRPNVEYTPAEVKAQLTTVADRLETTFARYYRAVENYRKLSALEKAFTTQPQPPTL